MLVLYFSSIPQISLSYVCFLFVSQKDFMQISKTMRERMSVRRRKGDKPKQTEISNKFPLEGM